MRKAFLGVLSLVLSFVVLQTWARAPQEKDNDPSVRELPPIAGAPYETVQAIVKRHEKELMQLPGVYFVGVGAKGILVGILSTLRTEP